MAGRSVHDQNGDGLDACSLGLHDAFFGFAEMHALELVFRRVDGLGDILFGFVSAETSNDSNSDERN